jgi:phenylacetate-coenzyme A ligase PaaK-like adenylate-forming protein
MDFNTSREKLITEITNLSSLDFENVALKLFRFQAKYNPVYAKFISLLSIIPESVENISEIPFLPISLFKKYEIKTGDWKEKAVFSSSGTTGQTVSNHFIRSLNWYNEVAVKGFEYHFG